MIKGERNVYVGAHVRPDVKEKLSAVAGPLGVSEFIARAIENELRHFATPELWYLAGPMSGIPECNYPAFERACVEIRALGYRVLSPHEAFPNQTGDIDWHVCLRHDLGSLVTCAGVILLEGWTKSKGARLEVNIALTLEMPVVLWQGGQLVSMY